VAYVRKSRIFKLVWPEDSDLASLEVRVKSIPFGQLIFELAPVLSGIGDLFEGDLTDLTPDDLERARKPFELVADSLMSWNIEDKDEETGEVTPVPCTLAGLLSLDPPEVMGILRAWIEAAASVASPLGNDSSTTPPTLPPTPPVQQRPPIEDTLQVQPL
jgi:hypothetical protein